VGDKELDGLLVVESADRAELVTRGEPAWLSDLQAALDAARRDRALRALGVTPEALGAALAPVDVAVTIHETTGRQTSRGERWFVIALLLLMVLAVFLGNAYMFVGITGEKQLRVTEQVVAAISPQTWIDGKILGISALAIALVAVYGAGALAALGAMNLAGAGITIPFAAVDPARVALYLVLALLGFLFWFACFAAIAATVNDPNTSARGTFMFLPLLPIGFAFAALRVPDAPLLVALGIFPATSPAVLPARLVLGEVAAWEVAAAIVLLVLSIWALRLAAGKVFALGILMFGKEPTWAEMWYWVRRA
jgi:ABC-2 type transport system permease protein